LDSSVPARFGDPAAPRALNSRMQRAAIPIQVILVVFVVIGAGTRLARSISVGDIPTTVIGVFFSVLLVMLVPAGLMLWRRYWLAVQRAAKTVAAANPGTKVFGASLPKLTVAEPTSAWPLSAGETPLPRKMVALFDTKGITVFSPSVPPVPITSIRWTEVRRVISCEFVEGRLAYDGIAVLKLSGDAALVLQLWKTSRELLRPYDGDQISGLASELDSLRSAS